MCEQYLSHFKFVLKTATQKKNEFARVPILTFPRCNYPHESAILRCSSCLKMETIEAPIFSLLVFPDAAMPCRDFRSDDGCARNDCLLIHDEDSSLLTLVELLDDAQTSMDICVSNAITCEEVRLV